MISLLQTGEFQKRATDLGRRLEAGLSALVGHGLVQVRARGLWAGLDIDSTLMSGREMCEALMERGLLAKDTHGSTIRLAPPLVVTADDVDLIVDSVASVLRERSAA